MPSIIFVPGHRLEPWDQMSPYLKARLEMAAGLLRTGEYHYILVTGGKPMPGQQRSEAEVMKEWLIGAGVNEQFIVAEDRSLDSFENVKFGLARLRAMGLRYLDFVVVSQYEHALRVQLTLEAELGDDMVKTCRVKPDFPIRRRIFEWLAIAYTALNPRGCWPMSKWKTSVHWFKRV